MSSCADMLNIDIYIHINEWLHIYYTTHIKNIGRENCVLLFSFWEHALEITLICPLYLSYWEENMFLYNNYWSYKKSPTFSCCINASHEVLVQKQTPL